jgi:hypothetical protein
MITLKRIDFEFDAAIDYARLGSSTNRSWQELTFGSICLQCGRVDEQNGVAMDDDEQVIDKLRNRVFAGFMGEFVVDLMRVLPAGFEVVPAFIDVTILSSFHTSLSWLERCFEWRDSSGRTLSDTDTKQVTLDKTHEFATAWVLDRLINVYPDTAAKHEFSSLLWSREASLHWIFQPCLDQGNLRPSRVEVPSALATSVFLDFFERFFCELEARLLAGFASGVTLYGSGEPVLRVANTINHMRDMARAAVVAKRTNWFATQRAISTVGKSKSPATN